MKKIKKLISLILLCLFFCYPITCLAAAYVSDSNVVSYKTPENLLQTELIWSLKLGKSYRDSPCPPIIVNNTVITISGKTLYKLNSNNGKTIQTAELIDKISYGYTPVTYSNGVIYCPLNNGKIQAVDYKTFKSVWTYSDNLSGQSLTKITADNNYIYTGFWNDEDEYANYVCLNKKSGKLMWAYKSIGGFYWAGCTLVENYAVFGTDDGTSYSNKPSKIICVNKSSGKVIDTFSTVGDIRCSLTYYNNKLYFVSKAGYFYSIQINSDGHFDKESAKRITISGASTSTPVICNNKAYIGVQGKGFSTGYIKAIDISSLKELYSIQTKGYPQNSVFVSDAYFKDNGKIMIYSTYNSAPGGITAITEISSQPKPESEEIFLPTGDDADYCISSIVSDEDGTLFYKNDSGKIFALSNASNKISFFMKAIKAIISFFKNLFITH